VHVPRPDGISSGWAIDAQSSLPGLPLEDFDPKSLEGPWYKVMGLDSRYDCFDCQKNTFSLKAKGNAFAGKEGAKTAALEILQKKIDSYVPGTSFTSKEQSDSKMDSFSSDIRIAMEAVFHIPRPTFPGYLENRIKEELSVVDASKYKAESQAADDVAIPTFQSEGRMFGLTFWENWYLLGDSRRGTSLQTEADRLRSAAGLPVKQPPAPLRILSKVASGGPRPDMKLVFYTGHTLQGSYNGAFIYSRLPELTPVGEATAKELISNAGLNPNDFCIVRNQCFLNDNNFKPKKPGIYTEKNPEDDGPAWVIGEKFFQLSRKLAEELADWFEDPTLLSEWLVNQQQRVVFEKPLAVSPFADLPLGENKGSFKPTSSNILKDVVSINVEAFTNLPNLFTVDGGQSTSSPDDNDYTD
jgi:hypothetical protein